MSEVPSRARGVSESLAQLNVQIVEDDFPAVREVDMKLIELANTDGLTGLANRARFDEQLAQLIDQKRQLPSSDFTVVMVDINGLKQANDLHGHEVGDRLIVAAGRALRSTCRDTSTTRARTTDDDLSAPCPAPAAASRRRA